MAAAMFLPKRGIINIHRARSVADGVSITSSRYFASQGNNGKEKSKEEAFGTTTDGKAQNLTMSHAVDTAKDGLKRATDAAIEKSGDARKSKSEEKNDEGDDENVAVGKEGTVKGENQSSG